MVFLVETHNATHFAPSRGWNEINISHPHKGLTILYKKAIELRILASKSRHIAFEAFLNDRWVSCLFLYGHAGKKPDATWWNNLSLPKYDIILGDFNLVLDPKRDRATNKDTCPKPVRSFLVSALSGHTDIAIHKNCLDMTLLRGGHPISRIDRIYIKNSWAHLVHKYNIIGAVSQHDHCIIYSNIIFNRPHPQSWKFRNHIFNHQKFNQQICDTISKVKLTDWTNMKPKIVENLTKLQKKIFQKQQKEKHKIMRTLKKIPKKANNRNIYEDKLRRITDKLLDQKKMMYNLGDAKFKDLPSQMLTNKIKSEEEKSVIKEIFVDNNTLTSDPKIIKDEFASFYANLYKKIPFQQEKLQRFLQDWQSDVDTSTLDNPITFKEVIEAMKKCNSRKASGEDGLTFRVLKNLPTAHLNVLVDKFNNFLDGESIPNSMKDGIVITIPKKGCDPRHIANRRPITLLNSDYKLLSKILAIRLSKFMDDFIETGQVGFMSKRLIHDNIIALNELLQDDKNIIINVDFCKAYDSINHDALFTILEHLRFPVKFTNLIKNMIKGSKARVLVNDELSPPFNIDRGVKQGDVISPFLFNIAIETLQKVALSRQFLDPPSINNTPIPIIMYADDVIIPTTSMRGVNSWMQILEDLYPAIGLKVNTNKSSIICKKRHIKQEYLPLPIQKEDFTFLGIRFSINGISTIDDSVEIVEKACKSFIRPSQNIFCRVSIMKSYILSKLWHRAFVRSLPTNKIEKITNNALWYRGKDKKKRTLVSSKRAKKPKTAGGLAIWDLKSRNQAFLASSLERMLFNNSKCSRMWEPWIEHIKLYNYYIKYHKKKENHKNFTPSHTLNLLILHWLRSIPLGISNFSDFYYATCKYRDIKELERQINLNNDPNYYSTVWTPRQKFLSKSCNLASVFVNISKIAHRNTAHFLWKFFQGGLPFSHNDKCLTCNTTLSHDHIFFDCIHNHFTAHLITKLISLLVQLTDLDGSPVAISPMWTQNFVLHHLGLLQYPDPLFIMITIGLKTTWHLFTKRFHEDWADPCETLLNITAQNISALYVELRSKAFDDANQYTNTKSQFMAQWKVPFLFSKNGHCFRPQKNLINLINN
jgi:hypothetical protein